jgi:hypothetical protein
MAYSRNATLILYWVFHITPPVIRKNPTLSAQIVQEAFGLLQAWGQKYPSTTVHHHVQTKWLERGFFLEGL